MKRKEPGIANMVRCMFEVWGVETSAGLAHPIDPAWKDCGQAA